MPGDLFAAVLGALAGASGTLLTVGKWVYEAKEDAHDALALLEGRDEFEKDGVIPRLRAVEETAEKNRELLAREGSADLDDAPAD